MKYYTELLESYSLLKKRALRVTLNEGLKAYSEIVRSNPNLEQPIATEMEGLTGLGSENQEPQIEVMKSKLQMQTKVTSGADGVQKTLTWYTANGDKGPIPIITVKGNFDRQGWKILQGQVARRLDAQNPDMQNPYGSSGRELIQDPLNSDTAKTQEEDLHRESISREIRLMSTTTLPNLITAGFAGNVGDITKKDSDSPGWVKDPRNHLDSYAPQSLWSKVNNEKVTEIGKIIEDKGGSFKGTKANWEDKHEGVKSMHEFAKKCLKLQQFLNGDSTAFTEEDARWIHTNVILDTNNNKVRYSMGEIDGYGVSFDHTTTKRSKQKETMSVGLARIYNQKIEDWVNEKNKKVAEGEKITVDQYKVPEKSLTPEQLKNSNWCSDFRGKQTEKIVGFVPHLLEISKMVSDYQSQDKRSLDAKELKKEIERKKQAMAMDMAKLFSQSRDILAEAFKVKSWDKKGEITSDEYTEGIIQTVDSLTKLGKDEREIIKTLFKRVVTNQAAFFKAVDSDFVFQAGEFTGPSEKADVFVTKVDKEEYLKSLEKIGIKSAEKRERIAKRNTKTLRELLIIEGGNTFEGLKGEKLDSELKKLLKSKTLYRDLNKDFDLDKEVYTIPLSLKTYITDTDTRLGQTRNMRETIGILLDPSNKAFYKKNQRQDRVEKFIRDNEKSLGVHEGPAREEYRKVMKSFSQIAKVGELIKGDEKIKNMKPTDVVRVVKGIISSNQAAPSLNDQYLLDYLTKNFERDKEDGRESVRLATFVERMLFKKAEDNILKSSNAPRKSAYKSMLASISMFTGMSGDSTFAMEVDLLSNKSKLYNQDDCIKEQALQMKNSSIDLTRKSESSYDFGNMSLKFERKGNSSVFGLKSKGCENIFKSNMNEGVLKAFLEAQAMLFETLLKSNPKTIF